MKKAHLLFLALACVMALSGCSVPKKPFRELTGAEIRSASVRLSPPDLTVLIQDTDRLAELLQDVTLYEADPSYTEYAGQAAAFTLELDDGTQTTVTAFSPFLILDGVGYRTKHGPCEALNRYANDLLAEDGAQALAGLDQQVADLRRSAVAVSRQGVHRRAPVPGRARLHRGRPLLERRPLV